MKGSTGILRNCCIIKQAVVKGLIFILFYYSVLMFYVQTLTVTGNVPQSFSDLFCSVVHANECSVENCNLDFPEF